MNEATCESRGASLRAAIRDLIQIIALYPAGIWALGNSEGETCDRTKWSAPRTVGFVRSMPQAY